MGALVPDWVTTQSVAAIKLSLVGAGRARDDGAITLHRCANIAGAARSYGVSMCNLVSR